MGRPRKRHASLVRIDPDLALSSTFAGIEADNLLAPSHPLCRLYTITPHFRKRFNACGISDVVYKRYCQNQASLQVLWDAILFADEKITKEQLKTKYLNQLGKARCANILATTFGFKSVLPHRKWRTLKSNAERVDVYIDVIKEFKIDDCLEHLKTKVKMHDTQVDFLRVLEDAKTVPVPPSHTAPDYWPEFTFQHPSSYMKVLSTGDGDSHEEHRADFIKKAPALKKSLKAAGEDAGRQLRQRYGSSLLRVLLQAIVSPTASTAKGTRLRINHWFAVPQIDVYSLLSDKFAPSDKEAGTFEADDLLDATQQEHIDAYNLLHKAYLSRADLRSKRASRGKDQLAVSSVSQASARSALSAA